VAIISHLNKVSSVSPYLVNVGCSVGEGPVRVCATRCVVFLWILVAGVSFQGSLYAIFFFVNRTLAFKGNTKQYKAPQEKRKLQRECGARSSISLFIWFYGKVQFLQPTILVVKDCKPMLLGVCP
jgi:hypothetical protein